MLFGALLALLLVGAISLQAQAGTPATTLDTVNVRGGPSNDFEVIGQLPINANVTIEGRNRVGDRMLVSAEGIRGWVASRYLSWAEDVQLSTFPQTEEVIGGAPPAEQVQAPAEEAAPPANNAPQGNGTPARILTNNLNLRSGPGSQYAPIAQLALNTNVLIEARNNVGNWALVNTGEVRGWAATRYLGWDTTVELASFPVSGEVIGQPASTDAPVAEAQQTDVAAQAVAPDAPQGKVIAATLNVRIGAASNQTQVGTLNRGNTVAIEARNSIGDWVLVNNGTLRGWVASRFIDFADNLELGMLPVSSEVIGVTPTVSNDGSGGGGTAPGLAISGDIAAMEAQLVTVPIVPGVTARARDLYSAAIRAGRNAHRFTKIGDCNSENVAFMYGFDWNNYSLGNYPNLQGTIEYFSGSFAQPSVAGKVGYSAVTVTDALWSDAKLCRQGEAPVWCELRTSNAAMVVIMFGANDISILTPERYESAMRRILDLSIQANVLPIVSTFPTDPAQPERWAKSLQLNLITVNLAREYDIPLINFWLAAKALPSAGMSADNAHLTTHSGSSIVFDGSENTFGFTMRNLVVLQTLDAMRTGLSAS
jgi:uncharacterized protein YraI